MHAIRLDTFGPPDHLRLHRFPDLTAASGQVRVAVAAAGVHLIDTALRRGQVMGPIVLPELPTVPGREVAGVVDRVGDGVSEAWLGRRIVAHLGPEPGGYADQAVTDVDNLLVVPEGVTLEHAVAAVGTGRTAQGIAELEPPGAADVVLVPSAAGGLGGLLVQEAVAAGATVLAAAGGERRTSPLEGSGATVIDYTEPAWADRIREQYDAVSLVYDGVGGELGRAALELLRPGGRQVMFGYSSGAPTRLDTDDLVRLGISAGWSLGPRLQSLPGGVRGLATRALGKVADGRWRPQLTTYPLADAARAHADLEGRGALGKVVLTTSGSGDPAGLSLER